MELWHFLSFSSTCFLYFHTVASLTLLPSHSKSNRLSFTILLPAMFSGTSRRPKGTQNRRGHSAGGSRVGAGRKRKVRIDSSSPEPEVAEPADASPSIAPAEAGPGEPSWNLLVDVIDLSWDFFLVNRNHRISIVGLKNDKPENLCSVFQSEQILILSFPDRVFMTVQVKNYNHRHVLSLCSQINEHVPLTQAIQIYLEGQLTIVVRVGLWNVFQLTADLLIQPS
jgi:hypothetical protein